MKNINRIIALVMAMFIFAPISVYASENSSENVFPQEEVEQLLEKVAKKTCYGVSVSSTTTIVYEK